MTTTITRLVQARTIISLIQMYTKDCTKQSFVNATPSEYMDRNSIIREFSALAKKLNFPSNDPTHTVHPDFCKIASQLYSVHNMIMHKDGDPDHGPMTEEDYNKVWSTIMGPLEKEVSPTVDAVIKAEQTKEREKKGKGIHREK